MSGELRASFSERDQYLDLLSQAYAEGRLDESELARRRDLLFQAVTHREIEQCFEGLPAPRVKFSGSAAKPVQIRPARQLSRAQVDRRGWLMIAGGLMLIPVAGALHDAAMADQGPVGVDAVQSVEAQPVVDNYLSQLATTPVLDELRSQGLDELVEMTITEQAITGTARATANPTMVSSFETVKGLVVVRQATAAKKPASGFAIDSVPWENLPTPVQRGTEVFDGESPIKMTIAADPRGSALITVFFRGGSIQFSDDGNRVLDVTRKP